MIDDLETLLAEVKAGRVLSAKNEAALRDARDLLDSVLETAQQKHLPGKHPQSSHGGGGAARPGMGDIKISDGMARDMATGSAGPHLVKGENGWGFTPERQALHDQIVNDAVYGVPVSDNPTFYVMGGGPAAGKSTMISQGGAQVPDARSAVHVNSDDVKERIPDYQSMTAKRDLQAAAFSHEESSYLAKRIQAAGMERRTDVVLDGTGDSSAASIGGKIDGARSRGYRVVGNYATVPTNVALERANARGLKTGRFVPETVIRETHKGVSAVFPDVVSKFDELNLFDTTSGPRLLARAVGGKLDVVDPSGYASFLAKAGE